MSLMFIELPNRKGNSVLINSEHITSIVVVDDELHIKASTNTYILIGDYKALKFILQGKSL